MTPEIRERVLRRLKAIQRDAALAEAHLDEDGLEMFGEHIDSIAEDLQEIQQMFGGAA